nr:isoform 3 of histone-lysine n-methyltransferase ehmt1 [Quercus suber]
MIEASFSPLTTTPHQHMAVQLQSAPGYDSMAAWDRFQCFNFHDRLQKELVALQKPRNSQAAASARRRGGIWHRTIDLRRVERQALDREDAQRPLVRMQHRAPSFNYATSSWSPPTSPGSLSMHSSPTNSAPSSPQVESPYSVAPSTPRTPGDPAEYADKVYAAACAGDVDHIDLLLSLGASVDAPTAIEGLYEAFKPAKSGHLSPCAGAAGNGQVHAVRHLLARGAQLNPHVNQSSSSPLHEACRHGEYEIAAFLLEAGADVNLNNSYNSTPLMYAVKYGSAALVSLILSYQPDLNMLSFIGAAAVHWAVWPGRTDILELLLAAGADINHRMLNGYTPLHCAAVGGQFDIVRCLLRRHADYTSEDQDDRTPLDLAEQNGHDEIAKVIRKVMRSRRSN